ncbi:hypothetical protein [Nitrosomonas sp.]|uniref:hypothetical protein n=1 Tax=Nitrosomonas sp. TaxID=42353 RepID=UPI00284AFA48|nr:hypothetical protein [Nitrosomonas sp.]MDR4513637.1 hypothetical protein [Nitrosomonas sp.]
MELTHYIYSIVLIILVILGIFAFLWTRDVFTSAVASLTSALIGFAIGALNPSLEGKVATHGEKIFSWLSFDADLTVTSTPAFVVIILAVALTCALCLFGLFLLLNNKYKLENSKINK